MLCTVRTAVPCIINDKPSYIEFNMLEHATKSYCAESLHDVDCVDCATSWGSRGNYDIWQQISN